ncbi:hypothetical protein L195_g058540, partial [Trifolium pratense]
RATEIWYAITRWSGLFLIIPHNIATSFALFYTSARNTKEKKGAVLEVVHRENGDGCLLLRPLHLFSA